MSSAIKSFLNIFEQDSTSKTLSISAPSNLRKESDNQHPVIQTSYSSNHVDIPSDFLKVRENENPIRVERIDFAASTIPEYAPYYATVLDNVLSASECAELLRLAVLSSPTGDWAPALVNVGIGVEMLKPDVRKCGRYILRVKIV